MDATERASQNRLSFNSLHLLKGKLLCCNFQDNSKGVIDSAYPGCFTREEIGPETPVSMAISVPPLMAIPTLTAARARRR
jgi:hypothetical protein